MFTVTMVTVTTLPGILIIITIIHVIFSLYQSDIIISVFVKISSKVSMRQFKRLVYTFLHFYISGVRPHQQATLPEPLLNSDEFRVLSARFKSLFSWPLIMGETPV